MTERETGPRTQLEGRLRSGGELRKTNRNGRGRKLQPETMGWKLGQGVGVPAQTG